MLTILLRGPLAAIVVPKDFTFHIHMAFIVFVNAFSLISVITCPPGHDHDELFGLAFLDKDWTLINLPHKLQIRIL